MDKTISRANQEKNRIQITSIKDENGVINRDFIDIT